MFIFHGKNSAMQRLRKHIGETLCATLKKARPTDNEQINEKRRKNPRFGKIKRGASNPTSQRFAPHLLLPQPHRGHCTKLNPLRTNVIHKKRILFS